MNESRLMTSGANFDQRNPPVVDFHMHSTFSDGTFTPEELAGLLHQRGVTHWSLTDHDTVAGVPAALSASRTAGLVFFAGIEISTCWKPSVTRSPVDIHVVGLGLQHLDQLRHIMYGQQQQRASRARSMSGKLDQLLKTESWPGLLKLVNGNASRLTRSHFARWLVQQGVVTRPQQAFTRFLGQGKGVYLSIETLTLADTIALIRQAGGVAVLAHPSGYRLSATVLRRLMAEFAELGGEGTELPTDREPGSLRAMVEREALLRGLAASYGSDFHGPGCSWSQPGLVPSASPVLPPVTERIQPLPFS